MVAFFIQYQTYALIACGVFNILLTIFTLSMQFQSMGKKKALVQIECCTAVLLLSDALAYIFRGDGSTLGFYMVRISNFLVFAAILMCSYFLNSYITALFMGTGRFEKLPKHLLYCFILPWIGMTFLVISQFTGIYYTFTEDNLYVRGPLFIICYIIPVLVIVLQFSFVVTHRKMINSWLYFSLVIFSFLPILAGVVQIFVYGLSLDTFAIWLAGVTLFWCALVDQNDFLTNAAFTEMATGLPNTYGYLNEIEKISKRGIITDYNAYYFDIARMGRLNDTYGKAAGDEIILKYAQYIRSHIKRDEVLGRLGGNFFVAMIHKENNDAFLKMLSDVPVEIRLDGKDVQLHLAAVAGCYSIDKKNIPAGQILGNTSTAVTYAKNVAHKPYVFLDETLQEQIMNNRTLEERLKKAFVQEEFEPYYQPKVNIMSNLLCGAEALARWKKDGTLVPPYQFVPIMEHNGSICQLDLYILDHVCRDLRKWMDEGQKPPTVSVNFSRKNLANSNTADKIEETVAKYDIPKSLIQIEVTETVDEYPKEVLKNFVNALRQKGFTVAIDDFGTGSSSISLLKDLTFDELKIDRTFIEYKDDREKKLLNDIIKMAGNIGVDVIAEGVEEKAQLDALKLMGCNRVQGYVFDKPLERSVYEERIRFPKYTVLGG